MKHKHSLLSLMIISIFCSCTQKHSNDNDNANEIYIQLDAKNKMLASDFIKKAEVIQLETNDDCLIFKIFKIQYVYDNIYILDVPNNSLFVFDKNGKFKDKLHRVGNGPGEYIQIMDFFIQDDNLFIMDYTKMAILRYNLNLEFIDKVQYEMLSSRFIINDDDVYFYNEPLRSASDYYFSSINLKSGQKKRYVPRKTMSSLKNNWGSGNIFGKNQHHVYMSSKYGSRIYQNNGNSIEPAYKIRFNKKNFPENENINDYDIRDDSFPYILIENFYISDKYLIVDYFYDDNRNFCFYEPQTGNLRHGIIENDLLNDFRFFPRWNNDNYLIEEVDVLDIEEHFTSLSNYNEQLKNITEDDNPVIVIYTLKSE